jgi:hypothetical protein
LVKRDALENSKRAMAMAENIAILILYQFFRQLLLQIIA